MNPDLIAAMDVTHPVELPAGEPRVFELTARANACSAGLARERQRAQDAMNTAKARFQGIVEIAEDAIISVDSGQRIVLFNHGAEKIFGHAETEALGQPLDRFLPPRFHAAHRQHLAAFAGAPEVARAMGQRREVFGLRKDGTEFPAEASISKLELDGEVIFTVILRDITERKQAAEALRASERFARGQAEALTRTLDALAGESSPDRIAEHVLRTVTKQLEAQSSSVWLRNEGSGLLDFEFALESGAFKTKTDATLAAISPSRSIEDVWPWPTVFRTGKPCLIEDIRVSPDFPWRDHLLAQGIVAVMVVPMRVAGQVAGVIGIRFTQQRNLRPEEMELAQALGNQLMLAMQLARLSAQSRQSAVMAERNRMARDIHDTLAQGFTGVIVQLEAAEEALSQGQSTKISEHLDRAGELARGSLHEARRSVQALRPQALEAKMLGEALRDLIGQMTAGTAMQVQFVVQGKPWELPSAWESDLLRIGQEALTNALRHARASEFRVQMVFGTADMRLDLRDNGAGFDPAKRHEGLGLQGMRERVEGMGGQWSIQSTINGGGTLVSVFLPRPPAAVAEPPAP